MAAYAQQPLRDTSLFFENVHGTVWAMNAVGDSFYFAGNFDSIGGIAARSIALWDGKEWSSVGTGVHGEVRALESDRSGGFYAGGKFDSAGEIPASNIAHWDGTKWDSLDAGVNDTVFALYNTDSMLYCGGAFTHAGALSALRIAELTKSMEWDSVGTNTLDGSVRGISSGFIPPGIEFVGEFTRHSNFGTYSYPLYCISTIAEAPILGGTRTLYSFLREASGDYLGLHWLQQETLNGTVYGIAPLSSKSFIAWGAFDTIDNSPFPGIAFFDGFRWRTIIDSIAGEVTCAREYGPNMSFFSVRNDSNSSTIFSYSRPDRVIAHYDGMFLRNDSASNAPLFFQYAYGYGSNCVCTRSCAHSGTIEPADSASLGSDVEVEELFPWSYVGAEIDNSGNLFMPQIVSGSGGNIDKVNVPLGDLYTIHYAQGGIMVTIANTPASIRVYNEIGQTLESMRTEPGVPAIMSIGVSPGPIFVRIQTPDQIIMRSLMLQ